MDILYIGMIAFAVCCVLLVLAIVFGLKDAWLTFSTWWWNLTLDRHLIDVEREAWALEEVRRELDTAYRKVHYRHNVHCSMCGRFARRAEGFPDGVSICKVHGIQAKFLTHPSQGAVRVIIQEIPIVVEVLPPALTIEQWPEIVIDYTDADFVADEKGLPVFTRPLEIEELR